MADRSFLNWPFLDARHRQLHAGIDAWARVALPDLVDHHDVDVSCRKLVRALGEAGFLRQVVPAAFGGANEGLDVRALCLAREHWPGMRVLPISPSPCRGLARGRSACSARRPRSSAILPPVARGEAIAAFALSEADAGSDVAAMTTRAEPDGAAHVRLNGAKTWISNGGIADHYIVFAREGAKARARATSAPLSLMQVLPASRSRTASR
jgi:acyl-CoA dehydrogenase